MSGVPFLIILLLVIAFLLRIDFIFYRDAFTQATGHFQGSVKAQLLGEGPGDKTPSGLWPSDHAGLAAALTIAPGVGHAE